MFFLIKTLKKFLMILNSAAAPWQVALGVFFGVLVGFLPLFPSAHGPAPMGWCLLFLGLLINCHLMAMLLFLTLSKLLSLALVGPAVALGNGFENLAKASADIPFLHASLWSHTGYLGLTLLGFVLAPVLAILMWIATKMFRERLREKLLARKKLVAAGKVGGNMLLVRMACWFFDL